ncbi:MAG: hypothetical protein HYX87_07960 [Chloroflexi bacterium]|nr:hypothetical protein [Chloroflexota bacterium]
MSLALRLYIGAVVALGAAMSALSFLPQHYAIGAYHVGLAAGLAGLIGLAGTFPFAISSKIKANVTTAPLFAAVLLLPPPLATTAAVTGIAVSGLILKRKGHVVAFNSGTASVYAGGAGTAMVALAGDGTFFSAPEGLAASVLAAGIMFVANRAMVMGAAAIESRKNPVREWARQWRRDIAQESALFSLGFGAAFGTSLAPWAMAFFILPVIAIQRAFASVVALNTKLTAQMEQLKTTQAILIQAEKLASLGIMATGASHQINNPVFVMKGRAEMLLAGADRYLCSDKARKHVESIRDMSDRVSSIIGCMLAQSEPTEDGSPCTDVNEALERMLTLLESKVTKASVQVIRDYQEDLPLVSGEPVQVQEVFGNLISNACDAMPGGGTLRLKTRWSELEAVVEISDTGTGIPEADQKHLFEPFFTTKKAQGGTGLGLYLAKTIADRLGGSIQVISRVGQGTTFRILLPVGEPRPVERRLGELVHSA